MKNVIMPVPFMSQCLIEYQFFTPLNPLFRSAPTGGIENQFKNEANATLVVDDARRPNIARFVWLWHCWDSTLETIVNGNCSTVLTHFFGCYCRSASLKKPIKVIQSVSIYCTVEFHYLMSVWKKIDLTLSKFLDVWSISSLKYKSW